ncbi:Protein LHY [Phytophthora citrophthora]|uniref:Protein LHY n=1 Tax=Phytophthora citrophthora TaxID=4793 RepID=A0AAD9LQA8_9STRA|nr:Protein LHY [Phytophthora citrophthora]
MASAAVLKSARSHPKLLSLQHVDDAFLSCSGDTPMTPLGNDTPLFAATVSPRDPAAKLAAASTPASKLPNPSNNAFVSHRVCIPSSASSDDASDDDDDDDDAEDVTRAGSSKPVKANTGRWTEAEHKLFLQGLETFPYRAWKKIATLIKTRTVVQIRTHAQKYYQKLEKEEARLKEREAQDRAAVAAGAAPPSTPTSPGSQKKKMHLMRKRKCSVLDLDTDMEMDATVLPSLPKRLAREQPLAGHMSPKQKMPSLSGNKVFFGNPMDARFMFGRNMKSTAGMQPPHQLPLDFADAAAEAMILDFAEDKALTDYSLDCVDQTLASIDNDDLLQLTEEELEWFSTPSEQNATTEVKTQAQEAATAEPLHEVETAALDGDNFATGLGLDDTDDDFVLDPEKFLSSYFAPNEQA